MSDVNVFERVSDKGERHYQYDFRLTLPDGTVYRERKKARGATSATAAKQIGLRRLQEVLRNGPPKPPEAAPKRVPTGRQTPPLCRAGHGRPGAGRVARAGLVARAVRRERVRPGALGCDRRRRAGAVAVARVQAAADVRDADERVILFRRPHPLRCMSGAAASAAGAEARVINRIHSRDAHRRAADGTAPVEATRRAGTAEAVYETARILWIGGQ